MKTKTKETNFFLLNITKKENEAENRKKKVYKNQGSLQSKKNERQFFKMVLSLPPPAKKKK